MILRGGLGNQLHQIAAGARIAEQFGGELVIFSHVVDFAKNQERRGYFRFLDLASLLPGIKTREVNSCENLILRILNRFSWKLTKSISVSESNFFDIRKKPFILLRGWFQSHEFLPHCINFAKLLDGSSKSKRGVILHIRLTDFLNNDTDPLGVDYYAHAINAVTSKISSTEIYCFSDDIQLARKMLPESIKVIFPEQEMRLEAHELLQELSNCEVIICSKSTLCWWAANVVSSNGGLVISPFKDLAHHPNWLNIQGI